MVAHQPGAIRSAVADDGPVDASEVGEDEFAHRCRRFREAVAALEDWPEVLVVTHWGVIRGLTGRSVSNGEWVRFDPHAPSPAAKD